MQEILRNIREMKKLYDSTILWLNERLENFQIRYLNKIDMNLNLFVDVFCNNCV